jgi:hypothetical protein
MVMAWIYNKTGKSALISGYLFHHVIGFWFWTANRRKAGHRLTPDPMRIGWSLANSVTGSLAILVAWYAR